jgi:hypothetical protein
MTESLLHLINCYKYVLRSICLPVDRGIPRKLSLKRDIVGHQTYDLSDRYNNHHMLVIVLTTGKQALLLRMCR